MPLNLKLRTHGKHPRWKFTFRVMLYHYIGPDVPRQEDAAALDFVSASCTAAFAAALAGVPYR